MLTREKWLVWFHSGNEHKPILPLFFNVLMNITPARQVTCSVTGEKYFKTLSNFLTLQKKEYLDKITFMQDEAPTYIAWRIQQLLRSKFRTESITAFNPMATSVPWSYPTRLLNMGWPRVPGLSRSCLWYGYFEGWHNIRNVRKILVDVLLSVHRVQNDGHIELDLNA